MQSIHYHPEIAATSLVASVVDQWQSMDQKTAATGHAPIATRMAQTPAVMDALTRECQDNPGQSIQAAASAVYLLARQDFDGF